MTVVDDIGFVQVAAVRRAWERGLDTANIARRLGVHESVIYNMLAKDRARGRGAVMILPRGRA